MRYNKLHNKPYIRFRAWSRKGYAIFASLGRQVYISVLGIHICMLDCIFGIQKYLENNDIDLSDYVANNILCIQSRVELGDYMGFKNSYL